jgi:hypothetical protein
LGAARGEWKEARGTRTDISNCHICSSPEEASMLANI